MLFPLLPSAFALVTGAVMGSFGNVVVLRGAKGESLGGRSRCPACRRELGPPDLVPVLSFLLLRGRCRRCKAPISWQYPLVEAGSAALFLLAFGHEGFGLLPGALLALCFWLLLLCAVMDLRTGLIHDALSVPLVVLGVLRAYAAGLSPWVPLCVLGGFFLLQWAASRGRWVGSGDILLGAGIGAMLGRADLALLVLLLAYILGAVAAAALLLTRRVTLKSDVPFGPFLAAAGIAAALWGDALLRFALP